MTRRGFRAGLGGRSSAVAAFGIAALLASTVVATTPAQAAPGAPEPVPQAPQPHGAALTPTKAPKDPAQPAGLTELRNDRGVTEQQQAAMTSAAAQAHRTGKAVAVTGMTTETDQVVAQPGGGLTLTANPVPVRTKQHGSWVKVDTTLHRDTDGTLAPAATAYGTVRFSGGGSGPLLTTASGPTSYALSWPTALPAPTVSGRTATYHSVFKGVDLVVSATETGGFHEVLVVHSASAAKNPGLADLALHSKLTGGHRRQAQAENGFAVGGAVSGNVLETSSAIMWDSGTGPAVDKATQQAVPDASDVDHPGAAARVAAVGVRDDGRSLHLTPDAGLLADPHAVYPLYIDPTATWHPAAPSAAPAFDEVKQGSPCNHVSLYNNSGSAGDDGYLAVGMQLWNSSCEGTMRTYYQWKLPSVIWGATNINVATVNATEMYSATCGDTANATVNLHWAGAINSGTDWNNQPGYAGSFNTGVTFGASYNPTYCPSNGTVNHSFNIASLIAQAAKGKWSALAVALAEDSAEKSKSKNGFKRFTKNPTMQISFDRPPATPGTTSLNAVTGSNNAGCDTVAPYPFIGKTITTNTPVLSAKVSDPDGDSVQTSFEYWVDGTTTYTTGKSGDNMASGSTTKYSLPSTFIKTLTNNKTVDWHARVYDGIANSGWSPTCHFTVELNAPDQPAIASVNNVYPDIDKSGGNGAAAGTTGQFTLTSSGTPATKFYWNLDYAPSSTNPLASQVVTATSNAAKVNATPYAPGPHTLYAMAVDAAGDVSGTQAYRFIATGTPSSTCASLAACFNNTAITADTNMTIGNGDAIGHSFSATDFINSGWNPGGHVTVNGATFTVPAFGAGQKDNVLAANQTISYNYAVPGKGLSALEFLADSTDDEFADPGVIDNDATAPYVPGGTAVTGTYCFDGDDPAAFCPTQGTITYTDGTIAPYYLTVPDWITGQHSLAALSLHHWNTPTGQISGNTYWPKLYPFSVPLLAGKTVQSVTLPDVGDAAWGTGGRLHIFGMATRNTTTGTANASGGTTATPDGKTWSGLWATPVDNTYTGKYHNMTIRTQLRHPAVAGDTIRIKLENAFNTSPLVIGAATVGVSTHSTLGGLDAPPTAVTFGGNAGVTVPAGGMIYSDPVPFTVALNSQISVSVAISNLPDQAPGNPHTNGTAATSLSALNSGDHTGDTSDAAFTGTGTSSGAFTAVVTNVDILTSDLPTQVSYDNSVIDPGQTNAQAQYFPWDVGEQLAEDAPGSSRPYAVVTSAVEGDYLGADNQHGGYYMPSALSRVDRDLLDEPNLAVSVLDAGLADVLNNLTGTQDGDTQDTPTETENLYSQLLTYTETGLYNNQNTDVVSLGLQPCTGWVGGGTYNTDPCTADVDDNRTAVNGWLKQSPDPAMYFIDTDTAVGIPDADSGRTKINPIYSLDGVNFINNGFAQLASAYQGPHDTWLLDDGSNDPEATLASDTASDNVNPTLRGDPTVGGTPADLQGDASWVADDHFGTAFSPGTSGGLQTEEPPLDTSHSFTYTVWAKLTDTSKDQTVLSQDSDSGRGFRLYYDHATNNWDLFIDDHMNPADNVVMAQTATASLNQWTGLVVEYNEAQNTFYLFALRPDNLVWQNTHTVPDGELAETVPLSVGYDGSGTQFAGSIGDVQAWSYGLTGGEMWTMRDAFFNQRTPH